MEQLCRRHRLPVKPISDAGRRRLGAYPWPGNVRELAHELERAIVFEDSPELDFGHLQSSADGSAATGGDGWFNVNFRFPETGFDLEQAIRRLIDHALEQSGQNVSAAARQLGVTRDYLRYRLGGPKERTKYQLRPLPSQGGIYGGGGLKGERATIDGESSTMQQPGGFGDPPTHRAPGRAKFFQLAGKQGG